MSGVLESSVSFIRLGTDHLGPTGATLMAAARQSFVDATGTAFLTAAGVLLLAAGYVFARATKRGELQPSEEATSPSACAKLESTSQRSAVR
jgi:hypothetical protein